MEKPLIKSQEPSTVSDSILNPLPNFYTNSERAYTSTLKLPGNNPAMIEYFDKTPGLFTYARDHVRALRRARTEEKVKLYDFMQSNEPPWQLPRWLRQYYENFISEYFAYLGGSWKLFDRLVMYLLIVYVFFLIVLFIKRLIFSYKPSFLTADGFVGDVLWYVKDKQIYHKFKLFYLINLFIFIFAVLVMVVIFVDIFKIVQTWEAFFYFTHVDYCVPTVKGNQHFLRPANWFFSKRESYTAAGINRKHFVEMLYYPKNDFFTRTRIYTMDHLIDFYQDGFSESSLEPRPRITKFDRMVFSNLPGYFWSSFTALPSNRPYVSPGCLGPR